MAPPISPAQVDTNVLVYALFPSAPQHAASRALLDRAKSPDSGHCVAPQSLGEFFAVVTNPRRVTAPKSAEEALAAIEDILALPGITVLAVPADLVSRWVALVRVRAVTGADVFDVQLAATMLANGVHTIYTFNAADFPPIYGINAIAP